MGTNRSKEQPMGLEQVKLGMTAWREERRGVTELTAIAECCPS